LPVILVFALYRPVRSKCAGRYGRNSVCFWSLSGLHLVFTWSHFRGGCLGVPRGFRGIQPSEPPANSLGSLTELRTNWDQDKRDYRTASEVEKCGSVCKYILFNFHPKNSDTISNSWTYRQEWVILMIEKNEHMI